MEYLSILQDIEGENSPVGEPDEDGKLYAEIDLQVMKFGSLQHDTINWDELIKNSIQYISEVCKDYKVLQFLIYALLQKDYITNLTNTLKIFVEFNDKYIFNSYPNPTTDKTINRFKIKTISLILNRLDNIFSTKLIKLNDENVNVVRGLISRLSEQLSPYILDCSSLFDKFLNKLESISNENVTKKQTTLVPDNKATNSQSASYSITNSVNNLDTSFFDLSNDRKLKQFYLQVADITTERDPTSALGYITRRYGLWSNISRLPEMNEEGITQMQAVPADKLLDYRNAVENSPALELLIKIEKTVVSCPYWIEGSYLAARCCQALHFNDIAEAIRNTSYGFVNKFPDFYKAKFQNAEQFIPKLVGDWLDTQANVKSQYTVSAMETEFTKIYQAQGLIAVLKAIDKELANAIDIRTRNTLQLEKINYFITEGMTTIALTELNELFNTSKQYSVEQWDESFFKKIEFLRDKLH